MAKVAVKQLSPEEIDQQELEKSLAYCDKMIAEGDDLERNFWGMVKGSLESGESKFEEWNNGRVEL
jgi:hypothetical protein